MRWHGHVLRMDKEILEEDLAHENERKCLVGRPRSGREQVTKCHTEGRKFMGGN